MGIRRQSVAIVGHGPSLENGEHGTQIDIHDLVVRMIECIWQRESPIDYGDKYNYGIYSVTQFNSRSHQNPGWMPDRAYWCYVPRSKKPTSEGHFLGKLNITIGKLIERHRSGGPHFSRGTAAAIISIIMYNAEYLTLFGFDMMVLGYNMKDEERHPKTLREFRGSNVGKAGKHNWVKERETILRVAEEHGTVVIFAPEINE